MKQLTQLVVPLLIAAACTGGDQRSPTAPDFGPTSVRQTGASISVTSLPSLGGSSFARAINDDQVIVGASNGLPVKWTFASGKWVVQALQSAGGRAEDVTESGDIVGSSGGLVTLWSVAGGTESIGPGFAVAINESRVVVALHSDAEGNVGSAWTWSLEKGWEEHKLPRQAEVKTGFNEPSDINDEGIIVGYAQDAGGTQHAVKWVPSTTMPGEWDAAVPLDDKAGATNSAAGGIVGQDVVGLIWRCGTGTSSCTGREPFQWSLTAGQGIGSLGSEDAWAEGLNAQQSIVGSFFGKAGLRAFVWTPANPTIRDLGIVNGYRTAHAYDINNPKSPRTTSQAVGEGISGSGRHIAVLWTLP